MSEPRDELERRVSAVEQDVAELRERMALSATDSAAARVLAAGADRDVSEVRAELRAHTRVLTALRETQLQLQEGQRELQEGQRELQEGQRELRGTVVEQGVRLARVQDDVRHGFATLGSGLAEITRLLRDAGGPG